MKLNLKCKLENIVRNIDGTLTYYFKDTERRNKLDVFDEFIDKDLRLEIGVWREKRSLNANDYFHLLVHNIAEVRHIGNDECKKMMNLEYGTPERLEDGMLFAIQVPKGADVEKVVKYPKWVKNIEDNGIIKDVYVVYKETHTLNSAEMSRLIEGVVNEAEQLGIDTIPPIERQKMIDLYKSNNV